MMNENDTLTARQQSKNNANAEKNKKKEAMIAKILAGATAGMLVGAGAATAANSFARNADATSDEAQAPETAQEQQNAEPTVEERLADLEEKERIRQQQENARRQQEAERQRREAERMEREKEQQREEKHKEEQKPEPKPEPDPEPRPHQENDFFREHEVKIEEQENIPLPDGRDVNLYLGKVDGHQAVFVDDGNGKITELVIDRNDNGDVDDNETIDLSNSNITAQDMAQHQVQQPQQTPEMTLVSVDHDVNMDGNMVDVATVVVADTPAVLVDTTQNGEVDVIVADTNHNGELDNGEVRDVSDRHIPMPSQDDIDSTLTAQNDNDMNDYSNDADTTVYEI